MVIVDIKYNGVIIVGEETKPGVFNVRPNIEPGDFEGAERVLSDADMEMVREYWTDEVIKERIKQREQEMLRREEEPNIYNPAYLD